MAIVGSVGAVGVYACGGGGIVVFGGGAAGGGTATQCAATPVILTRAQAITYYKSLQKAYTADPTNTAIYNEMLRMANVIRGLGGMP